MSMKNAVVSLVSITAGVVAYQAVGTRAQAAACARGYSHNIAIYTGVVVGAVASFAATCAVVAILGSGNRG